MFQLCGEYDKTNLPSEYICQVKYDGTLVSYDNGKIINRYGKDITRQFPEIKIEHLSCKVIGELCVFEQGKSIFERVLKRKVINNLKISILSKVMKATLVIFDITKYEGEDISNRPLKERLSFLNNIKGTNLLLPELLKGSPEECLKLASARGLEGIVIKDLTKPYILERNNNFLKFKCFREEAFKIKGFERTERGFVALLEDGIRVGVNNIKMRGLIESGSAKIMKVQYLERTENNKLRLPTARGVL